MEFRLIVRGHFRDKESLDYGSDLVLWAMGLEFNKAFLSVPVDVAFGPTFGEVNHVSLVLITCVFIGGYICAC